MRARKAVGAGLIALTLAVAAACGSDSDEAAEVTTVVSTEYVSTEPTYDESENPYETALDMFNDSEYVNVAQQVVYGGRASGTIVGCRIGFVDGGVLIRISMGSGGMEFTIPDDNPYGNIGLGQFSGPNTSGDRCSIDPDTGYISLD